MFMVQYRVLYPGYRVNVLGRGFWKLTFVVGFPALDNEFRAYSSVEPVVVLIVFAVCNWLVLKVLSFRVPRNRIGPWLLGFRFKHLELVLFRSLGLGSRLMIWSQSSRTVDFIV